MDQLIGPIGAFDENGVFGIGLNLPWGGPDGRSLLKLDMKRFVQVTRDTVRAPEKQNVLIVGKNTAKSFGWNPLPKRRMVIVSQTLDENELNAGRDDAKKVAVARNVTQAIERAQQYPDCGHIFLGGGETVWLEGIGSGLCNAAFITVAKCDALTLTAHEGDLRKMPHMLLHDTYPGFDLDVTMIEDAWRQTPVQLEFRNYMKP
jgi:dihydrofolate reductase